MSNTDYTDPSTIDVHEVIANINSQYERFGDAWSDMEMWPNVTVKALADEILRLEDAHEIRANLIRDRWLADPQNCELFAAFFEVVTGKSVIVEPQKET